MTSDDHRFFFAKEQRMRKLRYLLSTCQGFLNGLQSILIDRYLQIRGDNSHSQRRWPANAGRANGLVTFFFFCGVWYLFLSSLIILEMEIRAQKAPSSS